MNTVEIEKFCAYKKKLQGICDENHLNFRFRNDGYPITLTIYPVTGLDAQMSMFEEIEERGYKGADSSIVFIAKDGSLTYKTCDTFTISDVLFSKIKNLFKNMCSMWLNHFFHDIVQRDILALSGFPSIDVEETEPVEVATDDDEDDPDDAIDVSEDEEMEGADDGDE